MTKHYFTPYGHSFFNGNSMVISYKCKFCNTVITSHNNIQKMNKKQSLCRVPFSKATLIELVADEYDCSVHNETLRYKYSIFKKKLKKYINIKKVQLIKKVASLWLYIMSLRIS